MGTLAEYEAAVTASSPDAWWKLDEASGNPQDSSGNGFHMTTENITEHQADGPFPGWEGKAIRCDGSTGASRANVGTQMDDITFSCWINWVAISGNEQAFFFNQQTSATQGWGLCINANGTFHVSVRGILSQSPSSGAMALGSWYHVAVTRRSGTWRYYLNGDLDTANAGTTTPASGVTSAGLFGASLTHGRMAQASYWERSLTDVEIEELFLAGQFIPTPATWKTAVITTPGSTGSVSYTPWGAETPKSLIFYGTNWTAEDSVETPASGYGMFRGMAGPKFDDASLIQNSAAASPYGDQCGIDNYAIRMLDDTGANAELYRGEVTSIDTGGFTVDWQVAAAGHKVVAVGLMDIPDNEVGAYIGTYSTTFALGFKAGTSLIHGQRGGPGPADSNESTQEHYGGAAYPSVGWQAASVTCGGFPTAGDQRYVSLDTDNPTTITATGLSNVGGFLLTPALFVYPTGTGQRDLVFSGSADNGGMVVAWADEDSRTGRVTPAQDADDTVAVTGLPFAPGLVVFYSISNVTPGGLPLGDGALGFSVVTPDLQWCALKDGSDPSAFQSFERGFADMISDAPELHAGTVELTADGFVLTTVEDTGTAAELAWHAFGHPVFAGWIPQSYRRN